MNIYFAGAIRGGRQDKALYLEIAGLLKDYGHVLTEHVADAELTSLGELDDDRAIHDRDLAWLKESDCLVAEVTTPSLGVGYEIGKATQWGKPVLCLFRPGDNRLLSAMIAGSDALIVKEYDSAAELKSIFDAFFTDS
ncbi:MAG: 2'-deoxynucleoside 5'-phosphate N-hydrolase [Blastocatellia bacterium]|jgi:nucleoside 2-deoxyribosyltransferase|nr:2'-deoxynucleoside 5'-phosphate N-hydrolase [Blastocatellia bacterium]